jgi:diacylglycerol kinase
MHPPLPVEPAPALPTGRSSSLARSFGHAVDGIAAGADERNLRIHLTAGAAVLSAAALLPLSVGEQLALVLCVGAVMAAELFNTALEAVVDLGVSTFHPLARRAKDAAAGAVLVLAVTSVVCGLCIAHAHRADVAALRDRFVQGLPAWLGHVTATAMIAAVPTGRAARGVLVVGGLAAAMVLVSLGASVPLMLGAVGAMTVATLTRRV